MHLSFGDQIAILIVAMLTSKGASGVTGAGFIALAATLTVVNPALVPGVFSIDKFMSEVRTLRRQARPREAERGTEEAPGSQEGA